MNDIPVALKRAGVKKVSSNKREDQHVVIRDGALALFFGDELAERLLARQEKGRVSNG